MSEMRRDKKISSRIVTIQLGKKGLSDGFINEVKRELEKNKIVKVKILRSARTLSREEIASILSTKTGAKIVKIVGYTIILVEESL